MLIRASKRLAPYRSWRMINLRKVRDLDLAVASASGRPPHLSAASGLVCLNSFTYVIADDELHLGVFRTATTEPGHLIRVFEGTLAASASARKRQKPDLEALIPIRRSPDSPGIPESLAA